MYELVPFATIITLCVVCLGMCVWCCRWGNPTNDVAAQAITALEGGAGSHVTTSGMAAITSVLLTFLGSGDHVIVPDVVYGKRKQCFGGFVSFLTAELRRVVVSSFNDVTLGGTDEVLRLVFPKYGVTVTKVDSSDISNYEKAIKPNTKVLLLLLLLISTPFSSSSASSFPPLSLLSLPHPLVTFFSSL